MPNPSPPCSRVQELPALGGQIPAVLLLLHEPDALKRLHGPPDDGATCAAVPLTGDAALLPPTVVRAEAGNAYWRAHVGLPQQGGAALVPEVLLLRSAHGVRAALHEGQESRGLQVRKSLELVRRDFHQLVVVHIKCRNHGKTPLGELLNTIRRL